MPDPRDCKGFSLKIGFHCAQVPFNRGFSVQFSLIKFYTGVLFLSFMPNLNLLDLNNLKIFSEE